MRYDVCVFGGCSLDQMFYADENGNYSTSPSILIPGGKGSNQAVAASRAGAKVTIISRIGNDEIGQNILDNLQFNEISTNNVELVNGLTNDLTKIYIDNIDKDNQIYRENGAIDSFTKDMVEKYQKVLLSSKIIVAQMKIPKEVSEELINFCYKNNKPIIITPCRPKKLIISEDNNKELIDKITFITANEEECKTIFECDDVEECVTKYPNKLIVTLGKNGVIYHDGNEIVRIEAIKIDEVVDTTGAGDTFNGNLAYCLTNGWNLRDAIIRSQYASAMKIQKKTAQDGMPYKNELNNFIKLKNTENFDYYYEFDVAYKGIMEAYNTIKDKMITTAIKKQDKTFVTESDLIIEKILINKLKSLFPNDEFVTEETNPDNTINGRTWIIDPIDGTIHYMKNSIFWGIQLAFVDKGELQFSIIYLPKLDELYYAVKNHGAYLNNKKLERKSNVDINQAIVEFCGSIHKCYEDKKIVFDKIMNMDERVANFMHINSCCIAFTNLASGRSDTLILSTKKLWDVLPGILICKELGIEKIPLTSNGSLELYSNSKELNDKLLK